MHQIEWGILYLIGLAGLSGASCGEFVGVQRMVRHPAAH